MSHDPLCDGGALVPRAGWECRCALIDRVREDEFTKAWNSGFEDGRESMHVAALAAVEVNRPRLNEPRFRGGYDCCGCSTYDEIFDDAIHAIASLMDD